MHDPFVPIVFTRQNLPLHALLLENHPGSALATLGVYWAGALTSEQPANSMKTNKEP